MKTKNHTYHQHDFSHQDLSYLAFESCTFLECNFHSAQLKETTFKHCKFIETSDMEGCQFNFADLRDASFQDCKLAMANFSNANCFGIEFRNCDLKGANFHRANFANYVTQKVFFCSAYITGCKLSYTNLESANLEKCELFENRWIGAHLVGASMKESDLSRGVFSEDAWTQFSFQGANLCHAELEGLNPKRVDMTGVQIAEWQQDQLLEAMGIVVMPD